jgi:hypothetical protein
MVSTDRRFTLLLACALTAIVALGMVTDRGLGSGDADATAGPRHPSREMTADAFVRPAVPLQPRLVLQPLLTINLADRFPRLALAAAPERPILADSQIISYYGNPYAAEMGILGTADLKTVASQLESHAARYDRLNGPIDVVPAFHLVYAVAQPHPTDNGLYLQYVDDAAVRRYLSLTEERGMLLFLDLQIGRSSVEAELRKVLPYLRHPQVHVAIDPEFAVGSAEVPGTDLGSLRAADVDRAQAALQELVEAERLPPKLLIIHQFIDSMVLDGEAIQRYADVELIIDMDGFGPAAIKRVKYQRYAARPYAFHAGIKLFFHHDPDLMLEEEVLLLEPRPAVVIYQ